MKRKRNWKKCKRKKKKKKEKKKEFEREHFGKLKLLFWRQGGSSGKRKLLFWGGGGPAQIEADSGPENTPEKDLQDFTKSEKAR
jgi:hypothetical protein